MNSLVNLRHSLTTLITLFVFLHVTTSFAQLTEQLGTQLRANGNNCNTGQSETRIAARAGYIGTVGANVFPKVGDVTNLFITFQVLGTPCTLEGVYAEIGLPTGATLAVTNNRPVRCLLGGNEVTTNPEFNCRIFNEPTIFGGIVLGTNLLFANQTFTINVPVRFNSALNNGALRFGIRSSSATNDLFPEKSITVPNPALTASIAYPNPSTTNISSSSGTLNAVVTNNFSAGNVFFDFGTTTAYGTTSAAIAISTANAASNVNLPFNNLTPNTLFHWRARFVSGGQTFTGSDQTFRTAAAPANSFRLTVNKAGNGIGFVSDTTGLIVCGTTCSSSFTSGSTVTLSAQLATAGFVFAGWSGGGCSGTGDCQVSMTSDKTVTATFNTVPAATGSLAVTINGLSLPALVQISKKNDPASVRTLTATTTLTDLGPGNYRIRAFSVKEGSLTFFASGVPQQIVVEGGALASVTVAYTAATGPVLELSRNLKVAVNEAADSDGTVSVAPVIKDCVGGECNFSFTDGLIVTLTATKSGDSIFTGWGGDCATSGTAPTCILPIENRTGFSGEVTASFASGSDLELSLGEQNPETLSLIGSTQNTLFQVNAKAIRELSLRTLELSVAGSANDASDISKVQVFLDSNNDGKFSAGEEELATGDISENNGRVTLNLATPLTIAAGETKTFIVTWDVDPSVLDAIAFMLPFGLLGLGFAKKKTVLALLFAGSLLLTSCQSTPTQSRQSSTYTFSLNTVTAELATGGEAVVQGLPLVTQTLTVPR
jgi:hypothetical protein